MICGQCANAGRLNAQANAAEGNSAEARKLARQAGRAHEKCTSPSTCPCQHRTGKVLRPGIK